MDPPMILIWLVDQTINSSARSLRVAQHTLCNIMYTPSIFTWIISSALCASKNYSGEYPQAYTLWYTYIIYYRICQFWDYVCGLMTGLFAWSSRTALSRTYFTIAWETMLNTYWIYFTLGSVCWTQFINKNIYYLIQFNLGL